MSGVLGAGPKPCKNGQQEAWLRLQNLLQNPQDHLNKGQAGHELMEKLLVKLGFSVMVGGGVKEELVDHSSSKGCGKSGGVLLCNSRFPCSCDIFLSF